MKKAAWCLAIPLLTLPSAGLAQSKTGTAIGQFLLIEPSARFAAMGNAGVGVSEGIQSVYFNPGSLGRLERISFLFTHSEWFADINYEYASAALPLGRSGNVFASVTALNSGDIDVRTVEKPLGTGEQYTVADVAIGLGFAREVNSKFAAGIQLNYVSERIWHTSMKTVTVNMGAIYRISARGLQLGSSISHYGTTARFTGRDLAMQYDNDPDRYGDNSSLPGERYTDRFPVPVLFRVGLSMPWRVGTTSRMLLALDAFHPSDNAESASTGVEWTWKEAISLRGGYQGLFLRDSEVGLTLGVGFLGEVREQRFTFDYAWADHGRLNETHRLTFALFL